MELYEVVLLMNSLQLVSVFSQSEKTLINCKELILGSKHFLHYLIIYSNETLIAIPIVTFDPILLEVGCSSSTMWVTLHMLNVTRSDV